MYIVKRGDVQHVELIHQGINESDVKVSGIGKIETVSNSNLYYTKQEAKLVKSEINISKKFKKKMSNKKGVLTCSKCGKKGKHLTVDHIVPIIDFGGRRTVRKDFDLWKLVWDESNLQILCEDCNQVKDDMDQETFDKFDMNKLYKRGMILNNKKNALMSKNAAGSHKTGYGISTSKYSMDSSLETSILMHLAKMDSRQLYSELILG